MLVMQVGITRATEICLQIGEDIMTVTMSLIYLTGGEIVTDLTQSLRDPHREWSPSSKRYSHSSSKYESSLSSEYLTKRRDSSPRHRRLCDSYVNDVFQVKKHSPDRSTHDSLNRMGNYES